MLSRSDFLNLKTSLGRLTKATILVAITSISLSACQSNRVIETSDDSAEYRSAKALPPLKKPIAQVANKPASAPVQNRPVNNPPVRPTVKAPAQTKRVQAPTAVVAQPVQKNDPLSTVSGSVQQTGEYSRLMINADFDLAWQYFTNQLTKSEVTVFSRNKAAGRIAIGCGEIGNNTVVDVKREGGWSIFNRRKTEASEYCSLQMVGKRGESSVSVLDRAGREVVSELGQAVLSGIVAN